MQAVSDELRGAIAGFTVLLCKGLIDDSRWNWNVEHFDWKTYQEGFCDPTILRTTFAVFLNTLKLDDIGNVINYHDARFRAFQYFRSQIDQSYPMNNVVPAFQTIELVEQTWIVWED